MSILNRLAILSVRNCTRQAPLCQPFSSSAVRLASEDPSLQLGRYPKTEQERIVAAKKYNLIPEDYEPYPEDEGLGDYPKLPEIGAYNKDRYQDYDDPFDYRHYGEVFHLNYDMLTWERADTTLHERDFIPTWKKAAFLIISCLVTPLGMYLFPKYRIQINHIYKIRKFQGAEPHEFKDIPHLSH